MEAYFNIRPRTAAYIIIAALAGIYLATNLGLFRFAGSFVATYVIQPILWGLLAWLILVFPRYRVAAKLKDKSTIIQLAVMIGFFQVASYVIGGLFSNFGKSPYSFTATGIITNLVYVTAMLVGMELSRAWLINYLGKRHTISALAFATVLYTLLSLPLSQVSGLRLELEAITFLNSSLLPLLAENMLASLLAMLAGPLGAIAYRGVLQAFWWFCPILPDLSWVFKGLIGTAVPIIGVVIAKGFYFLKTGRGKARKQAKEGFPISWIIISIVAVAIIWFSVGLFPFLPTIVASGSMQPALDTGDVIIIAKVPADIIKEGDIIQFRKAEEVTIIHRVIEIQETEGATFFITKGDANNAPDRDPVIPENVVGKHVLTIPKIGWVASFIKALFTQ